MELYTTIDINAPATVVWDVLTDFPAYASWNPYIPRISGRLAPLEYLSVHAKPSRSLGRTFEPQVLLVDEGVEFRWVGRMKVPGMFNGEHIFRLEPLGPGQVRFVHREVFSGFVVPMHRVLRLAAARRGFEEMNVALKAHAEAQVPP